MDNKIILKEKKKLPIIKQYNVKADKLAFINICKTYRQT